MQRKHNHWNQKSEKCPDRQGNKVLTWLCGVVLYCVGTRSSLSQMHLLCSFLLNHVCCYNKSSYIYHQSDSVAKDSIPWGSLCQGIHLTLLTCGETWLSWHKLTTMKTSIRKKFLQEVIWFNRSLLFFPLALLNTVSWKSNTILVWSLNVMTHNIDS